MYAFIVGCNFRQRFLPENAVERIGRCQKCLCENGQASTCTKYTTENRNKKNLEKNDCWYFHPVHQTQQYNVEQQ